MPYFAILLLMRVTDLAETPTTPEICSRERPRDNACTMTFSTSVAIARGIVGVWVMKINSIQFSDSMVFHLQVS